MSKQNPIYTEITQCTDCSKCIRECPVKGIKFKDGHAFIDPNLCILCGHCTVVCPMGAKKIRQDLPKAIELVSKNGNVIASIAPSYLSEFPNLSFGGLKTILLKLGFSNVQETALGAQEVSRHVNQILAKNVGVHISSACPVIVSYIKKYRPELSKMVINLDSPLLAHCRQIKNEVKGDCAVVFFGPCVAKKSEADSFPNLLHIALTFKDLREWIKLEGINLGCIKESQIEKRAVNGSLYPIEGGMIKSLKAEGASTNRFFSYSGFTSIKNGIKGIDGINSTNIGSFFELLACDGGCINGPGAECNSGTAIKNLHVIEKGSVLKEYNPVGINIENTWDISSIILKTYSETHIKEVMASIGKSSIEDEINCGACGYSTCKDFAIAMLGEKTEVNMCLNYLRKLSEKKANTLINTMPSGVIMVDSRLSIVESNKAFATLMGEDCELIFTINNGLNGVHLKKILPSHEAFIHCLKTGQSTEKIIKVGNKILKCIVYSVVDLLIVGAIFRDITEPRVQRERIISKAQEVLEKNVQAVQKIAYLLGESAAESEVMLNSIIESFGQVETDDSGI